MKKKYYEVVFEGHYNTILGFIEGFLVGTQKSWHYFYSKKAGIIAETLNEVCEDWETFRSNIHHFIIEKDFYSQSLVLLKKRKSNPKINVKYVKSAKLIKNADFSFEFKSYSRKYWDRVSYLFNKIPDGLKLVNYKNEEKEVRGKGKDKDDGYIFEGSGTVTGELKELIAFREMLVDKDPLMQVEQIKLTF